MVVTKAYINQYRWNEQLLVISTINHVISHLNSKRKRFIILKNDLLYLKTIYYTYHCMIIYSFLYV